MGHKKLNGKLRKKLNRFIAIKVGQGDAFYLERDGKKILVDGGRSKNGFATQFMETTGVKELDYVVCTHADADHINGLIGLFCAGVSAKELWLPGKWTSRLQDILANEGKFARELWDNIEDAKVNKNMTLENIESLPEVELDIQNCDAIEGSIEQLDEFLGAEPAEDSDYLMKMFPDELLFCEDENFCLFLDAMQTASKIRSLARAAFHSGTVLRWFEFGNEKNREGVKWLKPINSGEITRISKRVSALEYLYLSRVNKESLVFYSPSLREGSASVLFSADSDFSFKAAIPRMEPGAIVTAPHHGSEHNKNAYSVIGSRLSGSNALHLVRSDGNFSQRPGNAFKKFQAVKFCTLCRAKGFRKQNVIFRLKRSKWVPESGVVSCSC